MAPKAKPSDRLQRLREDGYKVRVTHLRRPVESSIFDRGQVVEVPPLATLGAMRAWGITPSPKGGETHVTILNGYGSLLARGAAECSETDTFSRRIGLAIALGRAEKTLRSR